MIPAYSPQARGRSERSFGTWQGRLPQELRLAGINRLEEANAFLREHYVAAFNEKFAVEAAEKGSAFRRTARCDLDWVFTIQTERIVAKDNTVTVGDRSWQLEKSRFRSSLAGCTVTIQEHLDGTVSIRYGPHVVGRYTATRELRQAGANKSPESRGKGGPVETVENHKPVSHRPHRPLEIPQPRRDSHFPTAPASSHILRTKTRKPPSASRRGLRAGRAKADRSCVNQTGQIDLLHPPQVEAAPLAENAPEVRIGIVLRCGSNPAGSGTPRAISVTP
jgi:hypothetical protein